MNPTHHPAAANRFDRRWQTLLVAGAAGDALLAQAARSLRALAPRARLLLLLPQTRTSTAENEFDSVLRAKGGENLSESDFNGLPPADAVVIAISQVARSGYPALVRTALSSASRVFLFSEFGLELLDIRDGRPPPPELFRLPAAAKKTGERKHWVFFRPSDQTAKRRAERLAETGSRVDRVQTLASFEASAAQADAAFFDFCLCDLAITAQALSLALNRGLWTEAFLALDLADVCDDPIAARRIQTLNAAAFSHLDHIHVLSSRAFLADRYALPADKWEKTGNLPDPAIWTPSERRRPLRDGEPLRLFYHGLFYFWHEVTEFIPVYEALARRTPVIWDLYGRVHETVHFENRPLFAEREKAVRAGLEKLACLPGVTLHGYAPPTTVREAIPQAHAFVGITAGATLMAETEMRTGVVEAGRCGLGILHKTTRAVEGEKLRSGKDYIPVDSCADPEQAARNILQALRTPA